MNIGQRLLTVTLASISLLILPVCAFAQIQKVIISYSSRGYVFVPAHVAVVKGFFREQGLEALMVQMRATVAVPALVNGDSHYALAGLPTLNAIVQGFPFRYLAILGEKSLHHLVARPEIKSPSDLRGKKLGVVRVGGQDHLQAEAILLAKGIDMKDVHLVTLGLDGPLRAEILKKGLVDAISVTPPESVRLQKEGFPIHGGPADVKQGNPSAGVAATEKRVREKPDEVKKVLRAIVRGLRFTHERRDETIPIMMEWLSQSRETAAESYGLMQPLLSRDGATSDNNLEFAVEAVKRTIGATKPVPLSQVRDFTILREVQKELGLR